MASYDDGREYTRKSRSEMRVPKWNGEKDEDAVEYGEGYLPRHSYSRTDSRDERAMRSANANGDYYENQAYAHGDSHSAQRPNPRHSDHDAAQSRARYGNRNSRFSDSDSYYDEHNFTDRDRKDDPPQLNSGEDYVRHANTSRGEYPVYGGRDHDNIPPADMRPPTDRRILIGLCVLILFLVILLPMMIKGTRHVDVSGNTISNMSIITLATAAPMDISDTLSTDTQTGSEPTALPTLEPGTIVSAYTGRTLNVNKPAVALTFDDGPSNQTGRILDALEKSGGLSTFFLVGERIEQYAEVAQREYSMGNLVGTHLYSHQKLTDMTAAEIENELTQCNAVHIRVLGVQPDVVRAPYGSTNTTVREVLNMPLINWSLNSNDWETRDADRIYNDVMNNIQDGDIVLFHDLKDFSASAIERIVPDLVSQGYQLVTVQELFELKGRTLEPGTVYSSRVTSLDQ